MASDGSRSDSGNLFDGTKRRLVVYVVLALTILIGVASVGYAVSLSDDGSRYTGFYLLNENESGQLVAQDYSTTIPAERPYPMHVGIENNEGQRTQYTVVVKLQRMYFDNGTAQMIEEERLNTVQVTVGENQRWLQAVNVTPTMRGSGMRLVYLLYRDDAPDQPTIQNAYRETHVWLNVTAPPSSDESESESGPSTTSSPETTSTTTSSANTTSTTTSSAETTTTTGPARVAGTPDAVPEAPVRVPASRR